MNDQVSLRVMYNDERAYVGTHLFWTRLCPVDFTQGERNSSPHHLKIKQLIQLIIISRLLCFFHYLPPHLPQHITDTHIYCRGFNFFI
jgi:hypothetical protein